MKVFQNRVLRRIFRPERDEIVEVGKIYIMRISITCTLHQIQSELTSKRV
jgi:hypothetical protein